MRGLPPTRRNDRCAQLENVKWERDEVIGRLIERESRHRAQNAQMQREMLNVCRVGTRCVACRA